MDKTSGSGDVSSTELQIWPQENCRFAYTLGDSQPVRCTWISDQPLFYSDYTEISEDDEYLMADDPLFLELERDIADLRDKTNAYESVAKEFIQPDNHIETLFRADADFVGRPYTPSSFGIERLTEILHQSRLASQFLSFAALHGVTVRESNHTADAEYIRSADTILVRSDMADDMKVLLAVRELRRMWQHRSGAGIHPLSLHPDYAVLVNRAQQADMVVSMIRVAWELQLSGYKECWMHIENSSMGDLGRAFAREAIADFRSVNNGTAARATFESWFLSERCRKADRTLIQLMLADYRSYAFSDNPETSRLIASDLLKALGKMPFGRNYIESISGDILSDPVFTEVRDRSNANFLWFIKFERSFSEAEAIVEERKAERQEEKKASVLAFPKEKRPSGDEAAGHGTGAEIVDIYRPASS